MTEILYNTNDVANMLRVDKSTIKRWADEGKIKCFRTPGGHRKFHANDVYEFMNEFNYGISTLQILPQLANDEVVIKRIIQNKEYNFFVSVCFSEAIKGRKDEIVNLFVESNRAGLGVAFIFDFILRPTMKKISDLFNSGKMSLTEKQLASNSLISAMVQLSGKVSKLSRNNKSIICASLAQEKCDVDLKAIESLLEIEGFTVLNLGVCLTAESINQMIYKIKPFAVCIYSAKADNVGQFIEEIGNILPVAKENMTNLILSGNAFTNKYIQESFVGVHITKSYSDFYTIQHHDRILKENLI